MCPKLYLLGHVVGAGRLVSHFSTIDGGDSRSIDESMFVAHHGCQFVVVCSKTGRVATPTTLLPGAAILVECMEQTGEEAYVRVVRDKCYKCSRGATKCDL